MTTKLRLIATGVTVTAVSAAALFGFFAIAAPAAPAMSSAEQQTQIEEHRALDADVQLEVTELANKRAAEEARIATEAEAARVAEETRIAAEQAAAAEAARVAAEQAAAAQAAADVAARAQQQQQQAPAPLKRPGWVPDSNPGNAQGGTFDGSCGTAGMNTLPDGSVVCAG